MKPQANSQHRVVCAGEILIDLIGEPPGPAGEVRHFTPRVGGAPANVAAGLARLGVRSSFVGVTGDDEFGDQCRRALAFAGVETQHLRRASGAPTRLAVVTGPAGNRAFRFYGQPVADELLAFADIKTAIEAGGCSALYFGALPLATEPSRTTLLKTVDWIGRLAEPLPFCFDPNPRGSMFAANPELHPLCRRLLGQARIIKVSRADLAVLGLEDAELVDLALPEALIVVTDGRHGCRYWIGGEPGFQPAFSAESLDETGAGDAFMAALIARGVGHEFRFQPDDIEFASAAGALATTRVGAIGAMPPTDEIARLTGIAAEKFSPDQ